MVQFAEDGLLAHPQAHPFHACGVRSVAQPPAGRTAIVAPGPMMDGFVSYGARKPYVVAETLEELCGPTAGMITLPPHLDWSGSATYDLDKPGRLSSMYRSVLNEAGSVDDLRAWLDARLLAQLWTTLWLPSALRRVWEDRFPALSTLRASAV